MTRLKMKIQSDMIIRQVNLRNYEKATKFEKNLPPVLTKQLFLLSSVKTSGRFFQTFVAFWEKLDFMINIWFMLVQLLTSYGFRDNKPICHAIVQYCAVQFCNKANLQFCPKSSTVHVNHLNFWTSISLFAVWIFFKFSTIWMNLNLIWIVKFYLNGKIK